MASDWEEVGRLEGHDGGMYWAEVQRNPSSPDGLHQWHVMRQNPNGTPPVGRIVLNGFAKPKEEAMRQAKAAMLPKA